MLHSPYLIPASTRRVQETIRRSRFITTVSHPPTSDNANEFVARLRDEFCDATHNCWAFVSTIRLAPLSILPRFGALLTRISKGYDMRFWLKYAMALAPFTAAACQADLGTDDQMMSYSIGREIGTSLSTTGEHLDMAALIRGMEEALAEIDPPVPEEELNAARQRVGEAIQEEQLAESVTAGAQNSAEGEAYLTSNATNEGVVTTDSGLQYEVLRTGDGPQPSATDQVRIHYRGTLIDGTEFDSSYARDEPATFGVGGVITGFSEGLQLMNVGSHYRLVIPSELGYGPQGAGGAIGPNATLIFEIELLEIL